MDKVIDLEKILESTTAVQELKYIKHPKGVVVFAVLERDKHLLIKRKLQDKTLDGILSVFIVHNNKTYCVYGLSFVFLTLFDNYRYALRYPYLDIYSKELTFFKELAFLVYKNRSKNALVLGTKHGLVTSIISNKLNRIYGIDIEYNNYLIARDNEQLNKVHNVLNFYGSPEKTIDNIKAGKETAPGKKNHISIVIIDADVYILNANYLLEFNPIEFLIYGDQKRVKEFAKNIIGDTYITDKELFASDIFINRLKRKKEV